ncbi:unnamed protein product, partial [Musa textilis]
LGVTRLRFLRTSAPLGLPPGRRLGTNLLRALGRPRRHRKSRNTFQCMEVHHICKQVANQLLVIGALQANHMSDCTYNMLR